MSKETITIQESGIVKTSGTAIDRHQTTMNVDDEKSIIESIDMLKTMEGAGFNPIPTYWNPEKTDEKRIPVIFMGIGSEDIPDFNDNTKLINRDVAYFATEIKGKKQIIMQASKILVSQCKKLQQGNAFFLEYLGRTYKGPKGMAAEYFLEPVKTKSNV